MEILSLVNGRVRVSEKADSAQLEKISADFAWVEIDRSDSRAEMKLKELYGIESPNEMGFPAVINHDKYDLVLINYFIDRIKREIQVIILDDLIITVHAGSDVICNETIASANEMFVSGGFDTTTVLSSLFTAVIERHILHLRQMQESFREVTDEIKEGLSNIEKLLKLKFESKELVRVFYGTRTQLADIIFHSVPLRGVKNTSEFVRLYSQMNDIIRLSDDFSKSVDSYESEVLPVLWKKLNKVKRSSESLSVLSLTIAAAATFYTFFPNGIMNFSPVYFVMGILAIGLGFTLLALRKLKFKIA